MSLELFFNDARSVLTVVSLATFIGIVLWAYSARRAESFNEAANLPFLDEADHSADAAVRAGNPTEKRTEKRHG